MNNNKGREYTRFKVRERDGFRCQNCGKKWKKGQRQFDVHHLNGLCGKLSRAYDKLSTINTLVTLCHQCHCKTHTFKKNVARRPNVDIAIVRKLLDSGLSQGKVAECVGASQALVSKLINKTVIEPEKISSQDVQVFINWADGTYSLTEVSKKWESGI